MDYVLIGVVAFFASFTGTVIAMALSSKDVNVPLPSPIKTVKEIVEKRAQRKGIEKGVNLQKEWFFGQEQEEDVI